LRDIRFLLKTRYTNSRALIIGINQYRDNSPLSYAVNDAEEIRSVLVNELAFPKENVTFLKDGEATKENIVREFLRYSGEEVSSMRDMVTPARE
jgi:uncharacterized caspase-like protein